MLVQLNFFVFFVVVFDSFPFSQTNVTYISFVYFTSTHLYTHVQSISKERQRQIHIFVPFYMARQQFDHITHNTHSPLIYVYKVIENRFAISDNTHLHSHMDGRADRRINEQTIVS